jgi:hypothetical protein
MSDIKQCWAFHWEGMRCEHPAGHNGEHVVQKTWTDQECATPGEFLSTPGHSMIGTSVAEYVSDIEPVSEKIIEKCSACNHVHVGGNCKCGCYTHI